MTLDYAEPLTHIGNNVDHLTKALAGREWDEAEVIAQRMHATPVNVFELREVQRTSITHDDFAIDD